MGRGPSIEGRKGAEDARRAKVFTKIIREITVAARGGADPAGNSRLRLAIDKGLAANMPKDTIERAVRRGSGAEGGDAMQELRYEGYGPGGVAVLVDAMTDNSVRTVAEVRHVFSRHGGNLGTSGSVAFQFDRRGEIVVVVGNATDEEKLLEAALDAGADDVQTADGRSTIVCAPDAFEALERGVRDAGFVPLSADVVMRPQNRVAVASDAVDALEELIERLEALDDVQDVYHNAALPPR